MNKPRRGLSLDELIAKARIPAHTLRKWFFKLDIKPTAYVRRDYQTKKGHRLGFVAMYDPLVIVQVKEAMKKAEQSDTTL